MAQARGMIGFVDMAHPLLLADPQRSEQHLGRRLAVAQRLQALAGVPCLYQHYRQIDQDVVDRWGLQALILSGIPSHWRSYDWAEFAGIRSLLTARTTPILAVCGGSQVVGHLLGAPVSRLGRIQPGEPDPKPDYMAGWRKEWGYLPLDILAPADPLFANLTAPSVFLAHGRALKATPPGCTLLATRSTSRIQGFRLDGTMIYGLQSHPELYTDEHPDGRTILTNFFTLAGVVPPAA